MCIVKPHCHPHGHEDRSFPVFWIALGRVSSVMSGTLKGGVDDGRHELGNHWTKRKSWKLFSMKSAIPTLGMSGCRWRGLR